MGVAKRLVNSRKFWILVIGLAVLLLNRLLDIGLTEEDLTKIAGMDIAGLLGFGMADWGKHAKEVGAGNGGG